MYTNLNCNRPNPQFGSFIQPTEYGAKKLFQYADLDLPGRKKAFNILVRKLRDQKLFHVQYNAHDNSVSVIKQPFMKGHFPEVKRFKASKLEQWQREIGKPKSLFGKIKGFFKLMKLDWTRPEVFIKENIYQAAEYATKLNKEAEMLERGAKSIEEITR